MNTPKTIEEKVILWFTTARIKGRCSIWFLKKEVEDSSIVISISYVNTGNLAYDLRNSLYICTMEHNKGKTSILPTIRL